MPDNSQVVGVGEICRAQWITALAADNALRLVVVNSGKIEFDVPSHGVVTVRCAMMRST
jgi:hypothetical protein